MLGVVARFFVPETIMFPFHNIHWEEFLHESERKVIFLS